MSAKSAKRALVYHAGDHSINFEYGVAAKCYHQDKHYISCVEEAM